MNKEIKTQAVTVLETLPPKRREAIEQPFFELFEVVSKVKEEALAIKITDENQVSEMQAARQIRLKLKEYRVSAEKKRKELKADYLLMSKAIDGMANIIKAYIVPLENHLMEQEKFIEIKQMEARRRLETARKEKLDAVEAIESLYANLGTITEDQFAEVLQLATEGYKARKKKEKEEAEREKQRELAREKERLEAIGEAKKEREARQLFNLRFSQMPGCSIKAHISSPGVYYEDTFICRIEKLQTCKDKEFTSILRAYTSAKELKDAFKKQQEERTRQLMQMGFSFDGKNFTFQDMTIHPKELQSSSEESWNRQMKIVSNEVQRRREIAAAKQREAEKILEEKRQKEERARKLSQASDKEKLLNYASQLREIADPAVKSPEARELLVTTSRSLATIIQKIETFCKE